MSDQIPEPENVLAALAMAHEALDYLISAEVASLPVEALGWALTRLEAVEGKYTTARAALLATFTAEDRAEADDQGAARVGLRWSTKTVGGCG